MRLGFIVSGYKRPDLLIRLVRALEGRPCAIHIDRKSPIFGEVAEALKDVPHVHFLPRHNCGWGSFGHVEASLKGLRWLRTMDCDYAVLLTGQCYPLRTINSIERSLMKLHGASIIDHKPFPHPRWERGGWSRVDRFYVQAFGRPRPVKLWQRKIPFGFHPYGGGSYWCLSRAAIDWILKTRPRSDRSNRNGLGTCSSPRKYADTHDASTWFDLNRAGDPPALPGRQQ